MGKTKYYYNPETCQYERVRATFWNVFGYGVGVIVVGCLFFAGLFLLADQFMTTEFEETLYAENDALAKHQRILVSQLADVESSLSQLQERDQTIHKKLFDENITQNTTSYTPQPNRDILVADGHSFKTLLAQVSENARQLSARSAQINMAFAEYFNILPEQAADLHTLPTLQPVHDSTAAHVVSGFGIRINPFHKGKYMHPGLDFAAPRGTPVVATGPGRVKRVKRTSLKAGYGNLVEIDHGHGFVSRYAHLEDITVAEGQSVKKGMTIGTVGSSGGSIAPHVHYEILENGENIDPLIFMVEEISSQEYNQLVTICSKQNQSLD